MKKMVVKIVMVTLAVLLVVIGRSSSQSIQSLFTTSRASEVGDMVTVIIYESSLASQSTTTEMGKTSGTGGKITSFFGSSQGVTLPAWEYSHGSDYLGSGSTERQGTMIGKLTAQVIEVLPNGNLRIEGKRLVKVNQDEQMISVEGIIRPQNINQDNIVESLYIAEAKISYEGRGPLRGTQRPGILSRLLNWLGIF